MAKEKGGSLLSSIKNQIKNAGGSKGALFFVKSGEKARIRFLENFENGRKITFHDSFEKGINIPCQKHFGKKCKHCGDESLRTRDFYAWSVYNYEVKKEQIFMYPVNSFSPLPPLVNMFEVYGNIIDRDYSISRDGKGTSTQYGVVPLDKVKFKINAKPFSEKKFLDILSQAFDVQGANSKSKESTEEEEFDIELLEELSVEQLYELALLLGASKKQLKGIKDDEEELIEFIQTDYSLEEIEEKYDEVASDEEEEEDDDDEEEDDDDEDDDEEVDYEELSLKELKALAKDRNIKLTKGMSKDDIIELLEEDDEE